MPVDARLHLQTALREGKTTLQKTFCSQPFKIADVTEDRRQNDLRLMLMSSSPGVLDGDRCEMNIEVGEGCTLQLETQSYQRLFQMKEGASQQLVVSLGRSSRFRFLPHPVVPHQGAAFKTTSRIYLDDHCTLLWGEVISCGRNLNGEQFQFSLYHSLTEIFLLHKLVVKENLLLRPAVQALNGVGHLEGYTHQSTLLFLSPTAAIAAIIAAVTEILVAIDSILFGVSALPVNGVVVRMLGYGAEQLFLLQKKVAALLTDAVSFDQQKSIAYVA